MSWGYDLAGHVTSLGYPSQHSVAYTYDIAGRSDSFAGNLGDSAQRTYATGITYDAASRMTQELFGTQAGVYNQLAYNSRGQLADIWAGTSAGPADASHPMNWNRGSSSTGT